MRRNQNHTWKQVRRRTSHSNSNTFSRLILFISLISLGNYIISKTNKLKSPIVEANQTGMNINQLYITAPNTQSCSEGILNTSERQKVLDRLNYIRKLHGLNPIVYNYKYDAYTAKAALITATNADKYEPPNPSFRCWSEQSKLGGSNLSYGITYPPSNTQLSPAMNLYKSENFIDALLMDSRRENSAGSRWLLNPFLESISFGRVDGKSLASKANIPGWDGKLVERQADYTSGAAIKFIFNEKQYTSNVNLVSIAYPIGEYPKELFKKDSYQRGYPPMFFSVISDNQKVINQQDVDFSNSVIEIYAGNGQTLEVDSIEYKNQDLPNVITWKANNIRDGVEYTVKIKHVKVVNAVNNYEYQFKLR